MLFTGWKEEHSAGKNMHTNIRWAILGIGTTFGLFNYFWCKMWCHILALWPRFPIKLTKSHVGQTNDRCDHQNRKLSHCKCTSLIKPHMTVYGNQHRAYFVYSYCPWTKSRQSFWDTAGALVDNGLSQLQQQENKISENNFGGHYHHTKNSRRCINGVHI